MSDDAPAPPKKSAMAKLLKKRKEKSKAQLEKEERALNRQKRAERIQRAVELRKTGMPITRIAEEIGVQYETARKWVNENAVEDIEDDRDVFEANLDNVATKVIADDRLAARDAEQQALLEVAENQSTPADKYQAYVAASAIKMLRDNLMNVRGPRTVRELSELDQLIRRNLGLNPKGGSGSAASLTIDISILNNAKAANGGAEVVVDAEEV